MFDNLLIMRNVAKRIGVTPSTMYSAANRHEFKATKIGHAWFVDKSEVAAIEKYFKQRGRKKHEHRPHTERGEEN